MKAWHEARRKGSLNLETVLNSNGWRHNVCSTLEEVPVTPKDSGHFVVSEPNVVQYRISDSSTVVTTDRCQAEDEGKG